jgi:hypothetical protein
MFLIKLAVLSAVLYLALAVILQGSLVIMALAGRSLLILYKPWPLGMIFGVTWLASFIVAWHIVYANVQSKPPIFPH